MGSTRRCGRFVKGDTAGDYKVNYTPLWIKTEFVKKVMVSKHAKSGKGMGRPIIDRPYRRSQVTRNIKENIYPTFKHYELNCIENTHY